MKRAADFLRKVPPPKYPSIVIQGNALEMEPLAVEWMRGEFAQLVVLPYSAVRAHFGLWPQPRDLSDYLLEAYAGQIVFFQNATSYLQSLYNYETSLVEEFFQYFLQSQFVGGVMCVVDLAFSSTLESFLFHKTPGQGMGVVVPWEGDPGSR
ncbi:MAG TPA: hypothetical protein PLF96_12015 [Thermotogota bacterium]|nr:hypothetical protein [Thermotogota bacterium]